MNPLSTQRRDEIFISSTFEDLKEERRHLQQLIIEAQHIPVGMELFNAGHEEQWRVIQQAIDDCDYYVLLVANRYGSMTPEKISYTEKEYRYASKIGKPMKVFMLKESGRPGWGRQDGEPLAQDKLERLDRFRAELSQRGIVTFWEDSSDLKGRLPSVINWINQRPQKGWVRAGLYEEAASKLEVYTYLFNQLHPYEDVRLSVQFIRTLDRPLDSLETVIRALESLICEFVVWRVPRHIRVYFAYRLHEPLRMRLSDDAVADAAYSLGISTVMEPETDGEGESWKTTPWLVGYLVGTESNIHNCYETQQIISVDASRSRRGQAANQAVENERSVLALPALYGRRRDSCHSLGVVGMSSPRERELDSREYRDLAEELRSLFSALFHAYALSLQQKSPQPLEDEEVARRIRSEVASWFETRFGGDHINEA